MMARITRIVIALWVVAQCVLVAVYFGDQALLDNDCAEYERQALECYAAGVAYPGEMHQNELWIQSVGMVNYLILQLIFFGTFKFSQILNILLSCGVLWQTMLLARRLFDMRTAQISALLFCLVLSNAFLPIHGLTELPFLFLSLLGFNLSLSERRGSILLAGVCYAVAFTFRPLVLAFVIATLCWYVVRRKWGRVGFLAIPLAFFLMCVGMYSRSTTGSFVTSSTTGGFNLLMSANDKADGNPQLHYFYDDPTYLGYIPDMESMSFHEKDSIWRSRAIGWIAEHPAKYARLYVRKLSILYYDESWCFPAISSSPERLPRIAYSFVYLLLLPIFAVSLVVRRRFILTPQGLPLLVLLVGSLATCLFTVEPRYHYPYLFAIILWCAALLGMFLKKVPKKTA